MRAAVGALAGGFASQAIGISRICWIPRAVRQGGAIVSAAMGADGTNNTVALRRGRVILARDARAVAPAFPRPVACDRPWFAATATFEAATAATRGVHHACAIAAKCRAGYADSQAEINILGLFREESIFLIFV